MLSFKKVVKSTSKKENPDKKDQKNYMDKVKVLSNSCISFVKYLKKINENTDLSEMEKAFRTSFRVPMSKNKMLSRTSKKLHEMDKKLLKLKGKFKFEDVEEYGRVFVFEAKKADKNDYIKRSAIDDETIANTFNSEILRILKEKREEISEKKEALKELLEESEKVQDAGRKSIDFANSVTENINKLATIIKGKKDLEGSEKQSFINVLESNKKDIVATVKKTETQMAKSGKIMESSKSNSTAGSKDVSQKVSKELAAVQTASQDMIETLNSSIQTMKNISEQIDVEPKLMRSVQLGFNDLVKLLVSINPSMKLVINGSENNKKLVSISTPNVGTVGVRANLEELQKLREEKLFYIKVADVAVKFIKNMMGEIKQFKISREEKTKRLADLSNKGKDLSSCRYGMQKELKEIEDNMKLMGQATSDKNPQGAVGNVVKKLKPVNETINKNLIELMPSVFETLNETSMNGNFSYNPAYDLKLSFKDIFNNSKISLNNNQFRKLLTDGNADSKKAPTSSPFDGETGTFTVKNESDFEKMKGYENKIIKIVVEGNVKKFKRTCDALNNLVEVELGANCTAIKKGSFFKHYNLTTINLENVQKIGKDAFYDCKALKGDKNSTINLSKAAVIDESAFFCCKNIEEVILGENYKEIRYQTFYSCEKLKTINLENVLKIEDNAFHGCSSLNNLNLISVAEFGKDVFWGCIKLKNVTYPGNAEIRTEVEKVLEKPYAIRNSEIELSKDEKQIIISGELNVKKLDNFKDNKNIEEMVVRDIQKIESTNVNRDYLKTQVKRITLDKKCKVIGVSAFSMWENLSEINLENVRRIGGFSFSSTALQEIKLNQIEQMGSNAFSVCKNLKTVTLGAGFTKINKETFESCSSLSEINLGKIKKIGEKAFKGCSSLEKVDLESVETLEQDAFKGCIGLKEVTLPKNEKKAEEIKNLILKQVEATVEKNINFINGSGEKEQKK